MEKETNNSSFDSAILTATVETLKVLKEIKNEQDRIKHSVERLQKASEQHSTLLDKLISVQHPEDIVDMRRTIKSIETSIDSMDFRRFTNEQEAQLNSVKKFLVTHMDAINSSLHSDIESSNNAANLTAMKQLVLGLQSMDNNTKLVAQRMDKVSSYLSKIRDATRELSGTIMDSNSRVISMDTRLGSMYNIGTDNVDTTGDAITVLERYIKNSKTQSDDLKKIIAKNEAADTYNEIIGDKAEKYRPKDVVKDELLEDKFEEPQSEQNEIHDGLDINEDDFTEDTYENPDLDVQMNGENESVDKPENKEIKHTDETPEKNKDLENNHPIEDDEVGEDLGSIQDAIRELHEPRKE